MSWQRSFAGTQDKIHHDILGSVEGVKLEIPDFEHRLAELTLSAAAGLAGNMKGMIAVSVGGHGYQNPNAQGGDVKESLNTYINISVSTEA